MAVPAELLETLHRIHRQLGDLRDRKERGPRQIRAREANVTKVEAELANLVGDNVTDPVRIAQVARRTVGKWVGEVYRRQPMIVPTVIEI